MSFARIGRILALSAVIVATRGEMRETVERMFMTRMSGTDLSPESTGFIYRSDNQGPASYIKLGANTVNEHLDASPLYKQPKVFSAPIPLASAPLVADVVLIKQAHPLNSYEAGKTHEAIVVADKGHGDEDHGFAGPVHEGAYEGHDDIRPSGDVKYDDYTFEDFDYEKEFDDSYKAAFADHDASKAGGGGGHVGGHGGSHDGGHASEYGKGSDHGAGHHSEHGAEGKKGYGSAHHFSKGDAGHKDTEHQEGFYAKGAGGSKQGHDEASDYGGHYSGGKGYKGNDFGEKKGHDKGDKVDGFHKVYHKDEYKKDHQFYDDNDRSGKNHKYESGGDHHSSSKGGHEKKGSHNSGSSGHDFGKQGYHNNNHYDGGDKGHSSKDGGESYHQSYADHGGKGGEAGGKTYGFSVKH